MKIVYEIALRDVSALGNNMCYESPFVRRKRYLSMATTAVLSLAAMSAMAIILKSIVVAVVAVLFIPVGMVMTSSLFRDRIRANFRKMYQDEANRKLLGKRELELTDTALITKTAFAESRLSLEAISKIVSTDDHTFIYVGTNDAFVIPCATVSSRNYQQFIEAVRKALNDTRSDVEA